jgi:hypothetical protein
MLLVHPVPRYSPRLVKVRSTKAKKPTANKKEKKVAKEKKDQDNSYMNNQINKKKKKTHKTIDRLYVIDFMEINAISVEKLKSFKAKENYTVNERL